MLPLTRAAVMIREQDNPYEELFILKTKSKSEKTSSSLYILSLDPILFAIIYISESERLFLCFSNVYKVFPMGLTEKITTQ